MIIGVDFDRAMEAMAEPCKVDGMNEYWLFLYLSMPSEFYHPILVDIDAYLIGYTLDVVE